MAVKGQEIKKINRQEENQNRTYLVIKNSVGLQRKGLLTIGMLPMEINRGAYRPKNFSGDTDDFTQLLLKLKKYIQKGILMFQLKRVSFPSVLSDAPEAAAGHPMTSTVQTDVAGK